MGIRGRFCWPLGELDALATSRATTFTSGSLVLRCPPQSHPRFKRLLGTRMAPLAERSSFLPELGLSLARVEAFPLVVGTCESAEGFLGGIPSADLVAPSPRPRLRSGTRPQTSEPVQSDKKLAEPRATHLHVRLCLLWKNAGRCILASAVCQKVKKP